MNDRLNELEKEINFLKSENTKLRKKVKELDTGFNKMAKPVMLMGKHLMKGSAKSAPDYSVFKS